MFFQRILKGVPGSDDDQARLTLARVGILCRWWNRVGTLPQEEKIRRLTERNLLRHLNNYDEPDPQFNNEPFCEHTPFISATAGAVERDAFLQLNRIYPPFMTALQFATRNFTDDGYIYYGYVYTLGKKSVELEEFAEEVRELNIYTSFLPYQLEGEIAAKIVIPPVNLEKYEKYRGPEALIELAHGQKPTPMDVQFNSDFAEPDRFTNLRGMLE